MTKGQIIEGAHFLDGYAGLEKNIYEGSDHTGTGCWSGELAGILNKIDGGSYS